MTHALHLTTWHPYIDDVSGLFVLEQCAALQSVGANIGLIFSRVEGFRGVTMRRFARGWPRVVKLDQPIPTIGFKSLMPPGLSKIRPNLHAFMLQDLYTKYCERWRQPDILHCHVALESGIATRQIAVKTNTTYVVTEHSSEILCSPLCDPRREEARLVYGDAHAVIAVSSPLAERILDICPTANVKVIGNLVRDQVFALRQEFPPNGRRRVIISIGSLTTNKRTHNIMSALAKLPSMLKSQIEYWIIGDGPERGRLEALAVQSGVRTSFLGNLPHLSAMSVLSKADLLVHGSAYETFGVVLAEAMALGIPVVSTQCGGPEEIVTAETGFLVPVDCTSSISLAVQSFLADYSYWSSKRLAISQIASKKFHENIISGLILEAYK